MSREAVSCLAREATASRRAVARRDAMLGGDGCNTQSRDAARRSDARWHGSAIDAWGPKPMRQSAPLIRCADRREPGPTPSPRLPGSQSLGPSSSGGSLFGALTGAAASQLRGLASGAPNLSPCVRPLPGNPGIHVRGGTAPRPRSRDRGSGRDAPSPPCLDGDPRGRIPPKSGPKRAEFLRIFGPCGATSRGGGGAPPTTLILLRNQRAGAVVRPPPRRRPPGRSGGAVRGLPRRKRPEKISLFFEEVCRFESCVTIGCADVAVGGLAPASPIAELSEGEDRDPPAGPTQWARS